MKKSLKSLFAIALMLVITAVAASAQSAFTNALMGLNPAAYWPLQETVQPPAAYVETNLGSLGTIANAYYASTNAQILWTATPAGLNLFPSGDNNVGVDFKGSTAAFMIVPNTDHRISLPAAKPFTVEAWLDPTTFNSYEAPLSQAGPNFTSAGNPGLNGSTNGNSGWVIGQMYLPMIGQPGTANHLYGWSFHVYNGNGTGGAEGDAVYVFTTNTWYHVVGVFDGVNATLYINGTNQTSFQVPIAGSFSPDTWDPLEFGGSKGLGGANPYNGCVAEVAIYTNALSALTISNDYVAGYSSSGYTNVILANKPYMYWRMSAPPYTVPATNTYPTAHNYGSVSDPNINGLYQPGTLPGYTGPQFAGLGAFTNACAFNGLNSAVMVWTNNNTLSSPLNSTNASFSLAFWFKGNPADVNATVNPTLRGTNAIVSRGNSGWYVNIGANSAIPANSAYGNDGYLHWNSGAGSDLVSSWPYNDGNWHYVVAVYTNTGTVGPGGAGWTATNLLYVDGYLDNSVLMTNNATGGVTNLALFIGGNPSFTVTNLGVTPGYYTAQQYLAGSIAHVAYFTSALSGPQILNLYTNAASNQSPYIVGATGGGGVTGGTGAYTVFSVLAHGSPVLGYQWYFNTSSNYSGATSLVNDNVNYFNEQTPNMTVSNLANSESGYYYVVVNNTYGMATSALTALTVYAGPVITAQAPAGAFSLYPNQTATLSVTVSAATNAALTYQWYTNGMADTTAGTGAAYAAAATSTANNETFKCIVANTYGSATSAVDTATLLAFPSSLTQSAFSTNLMGLNPAGYWPMHEKETQPFLGDVETNYGSLGALGNGYYQDWAGPYRVIHNAAGAIAGDSDSAAWFISIQDTDLVVPHVSSLSTIQGPFTLEAWIKPTMNFSAGIGSYMVIVGQGGGRGLNGAPGPGGFALQYSGTPNTFSLVLWTNYGVNANYEQKTVAAFPPGAWYHLVATYDGISAVTYYVNGQVASYLFGNPQSGFPSKMVPDYWSPLTIGAGRWSITGTAQGFDGEIDEVAIYTNMLTSQQIQNDYLAGTTVSSNYFQTVKGNNPLLYYRMDAPAYVDNTPYSSLPVLTNYGTAALNGVYDPSAFPGFDAGPNVGGTFAANLSGTNAMAGNGVSSFADAGISSLWNPSNTNSFSYTAWFRGYPADDRNYNHMMAVNDSSWRVCINSAGEVQGHGNADISTTVTNNDGNWHQFVVTSQIVYTNGVYSGTNLNSLYVDGTLIDSTLNPGTNNPGSNPAEVMLGDEAGKTNAETEADGGRSFAGDMCEAAFFNYTLTPGQIQSLYNSAGMKPTISQNPVSLTGIVSLGFTNKVIANGSQPLFYQWYTNGVAIGGNAANTTGQITNNTTVDILTINPFAAYNAGTYTVIITNVYGSVTSAPVVIASLGPPVITNALPVAYTNQFTLYAGVSPTFSVQAVGAPTLFYYWYSNNVAITGQTNASYTLTNVQTLFTNIYCVASNFLGTATSTLWSASVIADPVGQGSVGLASYPQSVIALNPIAYWRLNEPDNGNSDGNPGLICHDYAGGNDGFYTNAALSSTSYNPTYDPSDSSAEFDFYGSANNSDVNSILGPDFATPNGVNAEFTIEAWINPVQAETTTAGLVAKGLFNEEEFTLDCGQTGEDLRFEVRNAAGTVYNANSSFSVGSAATSGTFNQWYHLVGVCDETNGAVSFYVNGQLAGSTSIPVASGITNSDAVPICIGSRSSSLPPYAFGDEDQQFYGFINDVAIFRYALSASQVANEYASAGNVAPFLSPAPGTNVSASEFATLTIPVTAYGSAPLSATWTGPNGFTYTTNGSPTATALNATLIVSNLPGSWNNNTLQLAVHNSIGTTNVTVALTIFTNAPTLTVNLPAQVKLAPGEPYTYSALAVGAAPLYYQWYTNGVPPLGIANQTNATFIITGGSGGSTAYYSLIVSNLIGSATSIVSTVTVVAPSTSAYSINVLNLHPVAYWPMHEVEAAAHGDIETNYGSLGVLGTGYYLDWGSLQGVNHGFPGPITADANAAVFFPWQGGANNGGFTNCLQIPHASSGATFQPPFTVEIWFWQTNGNAGDLWSEADFVGLNAGAISSGNGADDGIRIYQQNGSPTVYCYYQSSTLNGGTYAGAGSPNGAWQDVVMTVDVNTNATEYVNGISEGSNPLVDQYSPDYWDPITIATGKGYTRNTEGGFADFAVYPTNLSAADVAQHYNDGVNGGAGVYDTDVANDHPTIYLRMDSPAYSYVAPSLWPVMLNYGSAPAEGLYTPGTMPGAIAVATNGTPFVGLSGTNVALLSGVSSFADAGFANAYNVTGSNALSVTAMFRGYPCDGRAQVIVGHSPSSWGLSVNTSGNLVLTLGANAVSLTSAGVYNDGNWHQVVGVYQPSPVPTGAGTASIYVDGVLDTSVSTISSSGIEPGSTMDVMIGSDPFYTNNPTGLGANLAGEVCEVALYTNVLTSSQVQTLYNAAEGFVSVVGFTNGPPIKVSVANNQLMLNWPSQYVGYYYLQVQTNSVRTGISNNWVPYGGSVGATLNSAGITNGVNPGNGVVFYRLMTNAP